MHPVRPLRSLFHPAVFISMLGQAQQNSWRLKTHLTALCIPTMEPSFLLRFLFALRRRQSTFFAWF